MLVCVLALALALVLVPVLVIAIAVLVLFLVVVVVVAYWGVRTRLSGAKRSAALAAVAVKTLLVATILGLSTVFLKAGWMTCLPQQRTGPPPRRLLPVKELLYSQLRVCRLCSCCFIIIIIWL